MEVEASEKLGVTRQTSFRLQSAGYRGQNMDGPGCTDCRSVVCGELKETMMLPVD